MYEYDNVIKDKIRLLKCIKCESVKNVIPYKYSYVSNIQTYGSSRKGYVRTTTSTVQVPVCKKCNDEFLKWSASRSKKRSIFKSCGCINFFIILFAFYFSIYNYFWAGIIILFIVISIILIIIALINTSKSNAMETNPNNYMKVFDKNKFCIKPKNSLEWINYKDWLISILKERLYEHSNQVFLDNSNISINIDAINNCWSCGSKVSNNEKFCGKCGASLK